MEMQWECGVSAKLILTSPATLPLDTRAHVQRSPRTQMLGTCEEPAPLRPAWPLPGEPSYSRWEFRGKLGSPWVWSARLAKREHAAHPASMRYC